MDFMAMYCYTSLLTAVHGHRRPCVGLQFFLIRLMRSFGQRDILPSSTHACQVLSSLGSTMRQYSTFNQHHHFFSPHCIDAGAPQARLTYYCQRLLRMGFCHGTNSGRRDGNNMKFLPVRSERCNNNVNCH